MEGSRCAQCGSPVGAAATCPECGNPVKATGDPGVAQRHSPVRKISIMKRAGLVGIPVLALAGIATYISFLTPSVHKVISAQPAASFSPPNPADTIRMRDIPSWTEGDSVVFSLEDVYRYGLVRIAVLSGKTPRKVLAYVAPTGHLVTAISLSDHCGSDEFLLTGNQILCARCASRWDAATMEAFACCPNFYPDPIPSAIVSGHVKVARSAVERWTGRM